MTDYINRWAAAVTARGLTSQTMETVEDLQVVRAGFIDVEELKGWLSLAGQASATLAELVVPDLPASEILDIPGVDEIVAEIAEFITDTLIELTSPDSVPSMVAHDIGMIEEIQAEIENDLVVDGLVGREERETIGVDVVEVDLTDPQLLQAVTDRDAALEKLDADLARQQANLTERYGDPSQLAGYLRELNVIADDERGRIEDSYRATVHEIEAKVREQPELEREDRER